MPIINRIGEFQDEMTAWRRDLHAHPELGFEEHETAAFVAEKLRALRRRRGRTPASAETGVVGVLRARRGAGSRSACAPTWTPCRSRRRPACPTPRPSPGRMHACGHDGHTTMLLGAARYLAETRNFDGTVYFIFQPAEERRRRRPRDGRGGPVRALSAPSGCSACTTGPAAGRPLRDARRAR